MKKIYLFSTIVFILFSCTKEVVIPIDQSKAKLVVNGLFNTDSLWKIEVSASRYIYDTTSLPLINDANVTITDQDNNSLQLSNQGQGIYTSNIEKPEIGNSYFISVSHPDYDNVSSSNQLPSAVNITNIDWQEQILIDGELKRKVKITFIDSPDPDYYVLRLQAHVWTVEEEGNTSDTSREIIPVYFSSQNAAVENKNDNDFYSSTNFTDALFNDGEYTIDILADEFYFTGKEEDSEEDIFGIDSISIVMSKVSQEYYYYESSYQSFTSSRYSFAQPVQVYSNIENGHGIFAGFSSLKRVIDLNN